MKPCAICPRLIPAYARRRTCSLACRKVWQSQRLKGIAPDPRVMAACREARRRKVEKTTHHRFGPLSDRERALFNFAVHVGYGMGYLKRARKVMA